MTQKLIVLERNTKEELMEAIKTNVLHPKNNCRMVGFSVLEQKIDITEENRKFRLDKGFSLPKYYEAWCIVAVPDEKDKLYGKIEEIVGMTD